MQCTQIIYQPKLNLKVEEARSQFGMLYKQKKKIEMILINIIKLSTYIFLYTQTTQIYFWKNKTYFIYI